MSLAKANEFSLHADNSLEKGSFLGDGVSIFGPKLNLTSWIWTNSYPRFDMKEKFVLLLDNNRLIRVSSLNGRRVHTSALLFHEAANQIKAD